jgi:hypothetical protein
MFMDDFTYHASMRAARHAAASSPKSSSSAVHPITETESTSVAADCPLRLDQCRLSKGSITGSIRLARVGKCRQGLLALVFAKRLLCTRDRLRHGLMMEQSRSTLRLRGAGATESSAESTLA